MARAGKPKAIADIVDLRDDNTGRLLLNASRAYAERAIRALQARGHQRLTLAHAAILPHIDLAGTRVTALAAKAGMARPSASELVDELEAAGYVRRVPDPGDRRAMLVVFTGQGESFLRDAATVKQEIEAQIAAALGAKGRETLRGLLLRLPGAGA